MDIEVLASSSRGNAYTVDDGETKVLLECGIPFRKLQELTGFGLSGYAGCLLSHEHGDHSKAAVQIMQNGIDLYCSPGTAQALSLKGHRLKVIEPLRNIVLGTFMVMPFHVQHDCAEPYGYLLRSIKTGEKLVFATDTYYIKYKFQQLTHIMIEANYDYTDMSPDQLTLNKRVMHSHMSLDTVLDFLRANDLSRLQQIYLLHLSDDRSNEEHFKREVQRLTGAEVYVG